MWQRKKAGCKLLGWCLALTLSGSPFPEQTVYTDAWPPYVNRADAPIGVASRIVQLVLRDMGKEPRTAYLDYYFIVPQVEQGAIPLAYPFFQDPERSRAVLFSEPFMDVENALFYSSNTPSSLVQAAGKGNGKALEQAVLGEVAGYIYGPEIDNVLATAKTKRFDSEVIALQALLNGDIAFLPMSPPVARDMVLRNFPHRQHELHQSRFTATGALRVIAPRTPAGEDLIARFNESLKHLKDSGVIAEAILLEDNVDRGTGYVRLVPSDGYPVIIGQTTSQVIEGTTEFYTIPQDSRALVIHWSDSILLPGRNERLYPTMIDLTQVRIVSGPHAGKKLFVKNMHIAIE